MSRLLRDNARVPGLAANVAAEKQKLDSALQKMQFYPVASLGINWRF